jgi:hypothetical protein
MEAQITATEQNMKSTSLIWLIVGMVILAVAGTYLFYSAFVVIGVRSIETDVTVQDAGAFNLDADKLHFGGIAPGNSAQRRVHLKSDDPARVKITVSGAIAPFLSVSENNFNLEKNETRTITFTAAIPENTTYGKYSGRIIVRFLKP